MLAKNTVDDVSRLTKMFIDTKSPNGIFFTAKQLMLSRSNVETQASPIAFNNGQYLNNVPEGINPDRVADITGN